MIGGVSEEERCHFVFTQAVGELLVSAEMLHNGDQLLEVV